MRPTLILAALSALLASIGCQALFPPPWDGRYDSLPAHTHAEPEIYGPDGDDTQPLMTLYGDHSNITKDRVVRITSAKDWESLWSEHVGAAKRRTSDTGVDHLEPDFNKVMVIAVFRGDGARCPYVVHSILETWDRIFIREENCQTTSAFTPDIPSKQPWGMVILPRSDKIIVFQHDDRGNMDAPHKWRDVQTLPAIEAVPPPEHPIPEHLQGGIGPE